MAKKHNRLAESWTYVPAADRELPVEERTTFRLRPLSQAERCAATDDLSVRVIEPDGTMTISSRERQVALRLCRTHIESVDNYPAGAAQPWPGERAEREGYLAGMDDELVREIGDEIYTRSKIGELEKNS